MVSAGRGFLSTIESLKMREAIRRAWEQTNLGKGSLGEDTAKDEETVSHTNQARSWIKEEKLSSLLIEAGFSHQQAGLSACTIADNNKLASDFSHVGISKLEED